MSGVIDYTNDTATELSDNVKTILTGIKAKIIEEAAVSKDVVLTIESYVGRDNMPNGLSNRVTSQPSKLGCNDVIKYLDSAIGEGLEQPVNMESLLKYFKKYYIDNILTTDFDKVSTVLKNEIELVSNLYLPRILRCGTDVTRLGDLKVGYVLNSEDTIKTYKDSGAIISYLGDAKTMALGSLSVVLALLEYLKWGERDIVFNSSVQYSGTVKEYLIDQLTMVTKFIQYDVPDRPELEDMMSRTIYHTPSWVREPETLDNAKCAMAMRMLVTDTILYRLDCG